MSLKTIGERLDECKGIGPGFDFIRVALAFGVIAWHSVRLARGLAEQLSMPVFWLLVYSIVPVFFGVSGFLVTGSALRLPVGQFVASRVLRIVPALAVDTIVSILIIGAIFTTLPIKEYLLNWETASYLLNIVGEIHYSLPGVFKTHPITAVNGSLWTIRPELACYFMMTFLIATGFVKRWYFVAGALMFTWTVSLIASSIPGDFTGKFYLAGDPSKLVIFFLMGSLFFLLKDRIPYSKYIFFGCVITMVAAAIFGPSSLSGSRWFMLLSCPALTYIIVWLGLFPLPKLPLFDRGDYSYGVYLYGFPVQQAVISMTGTTQGWVVFVLTFVPVTLLAMMSWHWVEKPTLKLRKRFSLAAKIDAQRHEAGPVIKEAKVAAEKS